MAFILSARRRQRESKAGMASVNFDELKLLTHEKRKRMPAPDDADCIMAAVMEKKIMGRTVSWQERNVVLTTSLLAMGRKDEDFMLHCIPLHEITTVRYVIDHEAEAAAKAAMIEKEAKELKKERKISLKHALSVNNQHTAKRWSDDDFAILITTDPDGTSAGRTHVLRATSIEERNIWHDAIDRQVIVARQAFHEYVEKTEVLHVWSVET